MKRSIVGEVAFVVFLPIVMLILVLLTG